MGDYFEAANFQNILQEVLSWLEVQALNVENAIQLAVVLIAFILATFLAPIVRHNVTQLTSFFSAKNWIIKASGELTGVAFPLTWLSLQWFFSFAANHYNWQHHILTITVSLLAAWVVIRLASSVIRDPSLSRAVSITVWTIAALNIIGLLGATIELLNNIALTTGSLRISVLTLVKGLLALGVLVWAAMLIARMMEKRISSLTNLTPSIQVLLTKLIKMLLVAVAVLIAISAVGIDLTAFAVFGGALGVGIGLGLQKMISNLVSGLLILIDKSVKPGDVIEVSGTYGQVKSLGGRYASVITRDGIEHIIPNEELISQQVSNWSHSSNEVRLRISIGVSYDSDVRKAMEIMREAADETERVLKNPAPTVLLKEFGDSSINLEMRLWINDPMNGLSNVKSAAYLLIWDKFQEHKIQIPFPQLDLYIKSSGILPDH